MSEATEPTDATGASKIVAVLGYHKIGPPPRGTWATWNYVPVDRFREHLAILRDGGWDVLDADRLLAGLDAPERLPTRAVLLTFDDACRSLRDVAVPELARVGYPSVVFVPTDFIGGANAFDDGAEPDEPIMDVDDLRAVDEAGMRVESHGTSHRAFSTLDAAARAHEATASRAALEAAVGRPIRMLAFPFGDAGDAATSTILEDAGYRAAFTYRGGAVRWPGAERFALPRIPVGADTDLARQLAKARGVTS